MMEILKFNFRGRGDRVRFSDGEKVKEVSDFFIQVK